MSRNKANTDSSSRAFVPGIPDILFVAVFLLALVSGSQMLSIDSDLGRHLTIGDYILDHLLIPTRDLFSHTLSDQPRPPYEWLSQIFFTLAHRAVGLDGVILFTAVVIAISFTFLYRFATQRSESPILAFLLTFLAIGASSLHWLPRPHIVTFFLLTIWIEWLEQIRQDKPVNLFRFPLLMLLWANLHGGFIFGILAWGAYLAGWLWEKWKKAADNATGKKLLFVGFTSIVASVVTPDFWHNWEAVLNNRSSFVLSQTAETMRPRLLDTAVFPFTIFLALTAILFLINYKTFSPSHFFLLIGLGVASSLMARNIPLFVIAATPITAHLAAMSLTRFKAWNQIEKRFSRFGQSSPWPFIPLLTVVLAIILLTNRYLQSGQAIFQFNPRVFPVQAMDWLEIHPQSGRMLNEFNWGGYILHRSWPELLVFLDSQSDFYGEDLMRDYQQVAAAQDDWQGVLEKYQVDWALIPIDWPLAGALKEQGWTIAYQDQTAIILVRK